MKAVARTMQLRAVLSFNGLVGQVSAHALHRVFILQR
jgi:hypothetical protein